MPIRFSAIYGASHPMVGLQYLSLGRFYAATNRTQEARKVLRAAKALLTLTHGADHVIFRQQQELLSAIDEPAEPAAPAAP